MVLRCEILHDDANTATTAGQAGSFQGGAAYTAAQWKGWDAVCRTGTHDRFRDMAVMEEDVRTDEVTRNCFATVQFAKSCLQNQTYGVQGFLQGDYATSAGTLHLQFKDCHMMHGSFNLPVVDADTIINTNSKMGSTEANSDLAIIMAFSYGGEIPSVTPWARYRPNTIIAGDVSESATTADVLLDAYSQELTKANVNTMGYLDSEKNYLLYGIGYCVPVKDKKDMLCRIKVDTGQSKGASIAGFGAGDSLSSFETIYTFDSIPVKGSDQFTAQCLSGVASTPHIYGLFQEL